MMIAGRDENRHFDARIQLPHVARHAIHDGDHAARGGSNAALVDLDAIHDVRDAREGPDLPV
jgi:hypothetical protein